jgi:hypothetical protein
MPECMSLGSADGKVRNCDGERVTVKLSGVFAPHGLFSWSFQAADRNFMRSGPCARNAIRR